MKKTVLSAVISGLMFTLAVPVSAAQGPYLGISAGEAEADEFCDVPRDASFTGSCDDTDTAWKIFGGYQFTEIWGAEVAYIDFGEYTASGDLTIPPSTTSFTAESELKAISLVGTATLPIGERLRGFAKAGVYYWEAEASANGSISPFGTSSLGIGFFVSEDDDGFDLTFGLGAQFDFTDRLGARIEWERFADVGDEDETDIDFLSAGVAFSF